MKYIFYIFIMIFLTSTISAFNTTYDPADSINYTNLESDASFCFDGNLANHCTIDGFTVPDTGIIYQNYTVNVPISSINNVTWHFSTDLFSTMVNYTFPIPLTCNLSNLQTFINYTVISRDGSNNYHFYCHNNSDWVFVNSFLGLGTDPMADDWIVVTSSSLIDNCSTYTNQFLNYTYYQSLSSISTADQSLNISCTDNNLDTLSTFSQVSTDVSNYALCTNDPSFNLTCTGDIDYISSWTYYYQYTYNLDYIEFVNLTYLNLTVPKLYLNLSSATDITIVDSNNTFFFDSASTLIAMTNLSTGKVSVILNNGTQYYEFNNDLNSYYDDDLTILTNQDTWVNFKAQGQSHEILPSTIINIYHLNDITNVTSLVSKLFGNEEKRIKLQSGESYVAKAFLTDYAMEKSHITFSPEELIDNEVTIVMKQSISALPIWFTSSHSNYLVADANSDIEICTYSQSTMNTVTITWDFNDNGIDYTDIDTSIEEYCTEREFSIIHSNLTVNINADGTTKTFHFDKLTRTKRYTTDYYQLLLTSKLAFFILFLVTIGLSLSIHKKFDNYGFIGLIITSSLFSFLNLYMLLVSIPSIIIAILRRSATDEI